MKELSLRFVKILYLLIGFALLAYILSGTDIEAVWSQALNIGLIGMCWVLILYFTAFFLDSITWTMTIPSLNLGVRWISRFFAVRMVGEAFNNIIPAGGMGGEPVKAVLLKRHYGIPYREGAASLILAKTINMASLCVFLIGGFVFMMLSEKLSPAYKQVAVAGLITAFVMTGLLFGVQRMRMTSLAGTWLSRFSLAGRLEEILHHLREFDQRLVDFYGNHQGRFISALFLALVNWLLGAAEIFYAMLYLGHPVSWADAYIIEAVTQMVRLGTFFIPLGLGAQEGAFLLVVGSITGSPLLGLALGIVRRFRELIWVALGLSLAAGYSLIKERDAETS